MDKTYNFINTFLVFLIMIDMIIKKKGNPLKLRAVYIVPGSGIIFREGQKKTV